LDVFLDIFQLRDCSSFSYDQIQTHSVAADYGPYDPVIVTLLRHYD